MQNEKNVDFEFDFKGQVYWANCNVIFYIDSNFGSDIDGNRGTTKAVLDDVDILTVEDLNGETISPDEDMIDYIKERAVNRL